MIVKPLTEDHLEFLSLTGGCSGSSKSTHVKMPHCWKSHATAHFVPTLNAPRCEVEKHSGGMLDLNSIGRKCKLQKLGGGGNGLVVECLT